MCGTGTPACAWFFYKDAGHRQECLCHTTIQEGSFCISSLRFESICEFMKGYYRRNLPHIERFHAAYFVTFRTLNVFLPPTARSIALKHCLFESNRKIELHAAVIMPNHVHLLFTAREGEQGEPFSLAEIMKGIKGVSARNINLLLGTRGSLWQDESFDRIMRAAEFEFKRNYIIANPIDAGLCKRPEAYPWLWLQQAQTRLSVPHNSK